MQEKTYYRKKYLCLLLALVMLIGLFPSSTLAADTAIENHYYNSQDDDSYDLDEKELEEYYLPSVQPVILANMYEIVGDRAYIQPGYSFQAIQEAIDNPDIREIVLLPGEHRAGTSEDRFGTGLIVERSDLIIRGYDNNVILNMDNIWNRTAIRIAAFFDWDTQCCCEGDSGVITSNIVIRDITFKTIITNTGTHPQSPVVIDADGVSGLTIENIVVDTVRINPYTWCPAIWIRNSEDVAISNIDFSAFYPSWQTATFGDLWPPHPVILLEAGYSWFVVDAMLRDITIEDVIWPVMPHQRIELWLHNPAYFLEVDLSSISLAGFPYIEFVGPTAWMGWGNWWDRRGDAAVFRTTYDETWDSNHGLLNQNQGDIRHFYNYPGSKDVYVAVSLEIVICEETNTFTVDWEPDAFALDGGRLEILFAFDEDNPRGSMLQFTGDPVDIPNRTRSIHAIGRILFGDFPINDGFVYMREEVIVKLDVPHIVEFIVGETTINIVEVPDGETVAQPANPAPPSGLQFTSWVVQGTTTPWNFATPISEDLILVATFIPIPAHTITYTVTGPTPATFTPAIPALATHQQGANVTIAPVLTTTATIHNGVSGTWTFSGWTTESYGVTVYDGTFTMPANDVIFTGYWTFTPAGGGNDNGVVTSNPPLPPIWPTTTPPTPPANVQPTDEPPEDLPYTIIHGIFSPYHNSFIIGRPDGSIAPSDNITRAEVATIFFRLFSDDFRIRMWSQQNPFFDVNSADWFNNAISTVANAGIVQGRPNGTFDPNHPITRAEVAAITARFFEETSQAQATFTDINGHWAEGYINRLANFGWVQGSGDGTFRPNDLITRAEVAALINRMLNRVPESADSLLAGHTRWPDMTNTNAWYYLYLQEASHSTEFERLENGYLNWTAILPHIDWSLLIHPHSRPDDVTVSRRR